MRKYDVIVIGSGTSGQSAAYRLIKSGLKVALIDHSDRPGGTCALSGCQPKKWFYEVAEVVAKSRHLSGKGIVSPAKGDWHSVWHQKQGFVENIPENTAKGFSQAGIEFIKGSAAFLDSSTVAVNGDRFAADFYIVATGARPAPLPFEGAENLVTSTEFLELENLPSRILFVGGGFVSFEFAHFAARIGPEERQIKILEAAERPLGPFDGEMVDLLVKASAEAGIDVISGVQIISVEKKGDVYLVNTDTSLMFEADLVVHGASRVPWIENLNLEKIDVLASAKGIQVNPHMQTTVRNIFAVGDCADTVALARVADFEAHTAAKNILAVRKNAPMAAVDYRAVPAVLFSYPQLGMVGETEASLNEIGVPYRKSSDREIRWPTYRRIGMQHAGYKILAGKNGTILGAHILSDNVSGLIDIFRQAVANGVTAEDLYWQNIMTPYPSRESDIVYMLEPLRA